MASSYTLPLSSPNVFSPLFVDTMSRTRLVYLADLPDDPSYSEGYRCDYCLKYFDFGPLYHCNVTGTDACVPCARSGAPAEDDVALAKSNLAKVAFPDKLLFDTANAALAKTGSEEGALDGLASSLKSTVVLGYQCQSNVVGVLLANGVNILGMLERGIVAAGWVVCPGTSPVLDMLKSVFKERAVQTPTKVTATPVYPAHFATLFPWFLDMVAQVSATQFETAAQRGVAAPAFNAVAAQLPTFVACTSFPTESPTSGDKMLFLLSSDVLHVFSFRDGIEVVADASDTRTWVSGIPAAVSPLTRPTLEWARAVLLHLCGI